jgi:acyl phosphate:glycerol-3-phosphate acyltransferase
MVSFGFSVVGFILGSFPFSVVLARLCGKDIVKIADGNPGATNAWRACGPKIGIAALLLDFLKGALPVSMAVWAGISGWGLVPVILTPPLGHAFSPWLRFRGGKSVAVTFGVWAGATTWYVPTVLGGIFILGKLLGISDAYTVMVGSTGVLIFVGLFFRDPVLTLAAGLNLILLAFTHRKNLGCDFLWRS